MRRPTNVDDQLSWWRNAVATGSNAITDDVPRCGWFKVRKEARSKTWLPARIFLDQVIDWTTGELTEPERFVLEVGQRTITDQGQIEERWLRLRPASLDEWRWLKARLALESGLPQMEYTPD